MHFLYVVTVRLLDFSAVILGLLILGYHWLFIVIPIQSQYS